MDSIALMLGVLALTLVGVSLHAWQLGNERRDVRLLGSMAALCGLGSWMVSATAN